MAKRRYRQQQDIDYADLFRGQMPASMEDYEVNRAFERVQAEKQFAFDAWRGQHNLNRNFGDPRVTRHAQTLTWKLFTGQNIDPERSVFPEYLRREADPHAWGGFETWARGVDWTESPNPAFGRDQSFSPSGREAYNKLAGHLSRNAMEAAVANTRPGIDTGEAIGIGTEGALTWMRNVFPWMKYDASGIEQEANKAINASLRTANLSSWDIEKREVNALFESELTENLTPSELAKALPDNAPLPSTIENYADYPARDFFKMGDLDDRQYQTIADTLESLGRGGVDPRDATVSDIYRIYQLREFAMGPAYKSLPQELKVLRSESEPGGIENLMKDVERNAYTRSAVPPEIRAQFNAEYEGVINPQTIDEDLLFGSERGITPEQQEMFDADPEANLWKDIFYGAEGDESSLRQRFASLGRQHIALSESRGAPGWGTRVSEFNKSYGEAINLVNRQARAAQLPAGDVQRIAQQIQRITNFPGRKEGWGIEERLQVDENTTLADYLDVHGSPAYGSQSLEEALSSSLSASRSQISLEERISQRQAFASKPPVQLTPRERMGITSWATETRNPDEGAMGVINTHPRDILQRRDVESQARLLMEYRGEIQSEVMQRAENRYIDWLYDARERGAVGFEEFAEEFEGIEDFDLLENLGNLTEEDFVSIVSQPDPKIDFERRSRAPGTPLPTGGGRMPTYPAFDRLAGSEDPNLPRPSRFGAAQSMHLPVRPRAAVRLTRSQLAQGLRAERAGGYISKPRVWSAPRTGRQPPDRRGRHMDEPPPRDFSNVEEPDFLDPLSGERSAASAQPSRLTADQPPSRSEAEWLALQSNEPPLSEEEMLDEGAAERTAALESLAEEPDTYEAFSARFENLVSESDRERARSYTRNLEEAEAVRAKQKAGAINMGTTLARPTSGRVTPRASMEGAFAAGKAYSENVARLARARGRTLTGHERMALQTHYAVGQLGQDEEEAWKYLGERVIGEGDDLGSIQEVYENLSQGEVLVPSSGYQVGPLAESAMGIISRSRDAFPASPTAAANPELEGRSRAVAQSAITEAAGTDFSGISDEENLLKNFWSRTQRFLRQKFDKLMDDAKGDPGQAIEVQRMREMATEYAESVVEQMASDALPGGAKSWQLGSTKQSVTLNPRGQLETIQSFYEQDEAFRSQVNARGGLESVMRQGGIFPADGDRPEISVLPHDGQPYQAGGPGDFRRSPYGPIRAWYAMRAVSGAMDLAVGTGMTAAAQASEFGAAAAHFSGTGMSPLSTTAARAEDIQLARGIAAQQQHGALWQLPQQVLGEQPTARVAETARAGIGVASAGLMTNAMLTMAGVGAIPGLNVAAMGAGIVIGGAGLLNEAYNAATGSNLGLSDRLLGALGMQDNTAVEAQLQYQRRFQDLARGTPFSMSDAASAALTFRHQYGIYADTPSITEDRARFASSDMLSQGMTFSLGVDMTPEQRAAVELGLGDQASTATRREPFSTTSGLMAWAESQGFQTDKLDAAQNLVMQYAAARFSGDPAAQVRAIEEMTQIGPDGKPVYSAADVTQRTEALQGQATIRQELSNILGGSERSDYFVRDVLGLSEDSASTRALGRRATFDIAAAGVGGMDLLTSPDYLSRVAAITDQNVPMAQVEAISGLYQYAVQAGISPVTALDYLAPGDLQGITRTGSRIMGGLQAQRGTYGVAYGLRDSFLGAASGTQDAYGQLIAQAQGYGDRMEGYTRAGGGAGIDAFNALQPWQASAAAGSYGMFYDPALTEDQQLGQVTGAYRGLDPLQVESAATVAQGYYGLGVQPESRMTNLMGRSLSVPQAGRFAGGLRDLESAGFGTGIAISGLNALAARSMTGMEYQGFTNLAEQYVSMGLTSPAGAIYGFMAGQMGVDAESSIGSITSAMYQSGLSPVMAQGMGFRLGAEFQDPRSSGQLLQVANAALGLGAEGEGVWEFARRGAGLRGAGFRDLMGLMQGDDWAISGSLGQQYGLTPTIDRSTGMSAWQERIWNVEDMQRGLQVESQQFGLQQDWAQYNESRAMTFGGSFFNPVTGQMQTVPYGRLDINEAQFDISVRQQEDNLRYQEQQFGLSSQYQRRGMERNRAQQEQRFEWQIQDWEFGENVNQLQFAWQMEDFDYNIRYARGRDRQQMMRQRDRAVISESMRRGHSEEERDRIDVQREWAKESHELQKEYYTENERLQRERLQRDRQYFEERTQWQRREYELARTSAELQSHHQRQQIEFQQYSIEKQNEIYELQKEIDRERTAAQGEILIFLRDTLPGLITGLGQVAQDALPESAYVNNNISPNSTYTNWLPAVGADGANVGAGEMILVGEKGPEFFKPNTSGSVISNEESRALVNNALSARATESFSGTGNNESISVLRAIHAVLVEMSQKGGGTLALNINTNSMRDAVERGLSMYDETFQVM